MHWLSPLHYLRTIRPSSWKHSDLNREKRRLRLACLLASLGDSAAGGRSELPDEQQLVPDSRGLGFADTPGVLQCIPAQFKAFRAFQLEQDSWASDIPQVQQMELKLEAEGFYKKAADTLWESVNTMPKPTPDVKEDDTAKHNSLVQSLALMLLAYYAVKGGLIEKTWGDFGSARDIAEHAVDQQPSELYLRLEYARILSLLEKYPEAIDVLAAARGMAITPDWQLQLSRTAVDIASNSMEAKLFERVETDFLQLFKPEMDQKTLEEIREKMQIKPEMDKKTLEEIREKMQNNPQEKDPKVEAYFYFAGGRNIYYLAQLARDDTAKSLRTVDLDNARKSSDRFALAAEFCKQAGLTSIDSTLIKNLEEWDCAANDLALELALSLGLYPSTDQRAKTESNECAETKSMYSQSIDIWCNKPRPPRFAPAALVSLRPWDDSSPIGFRALARNLADRIDPESVALPPIPSPIVVVVNDALKMDEPLANRITGLDKASEVPCTIPKLRTWLNENYGITLPSVQVTDVHDPRTPQRISARIRFDLNELAALTIPDGACLAFVDRRAAEQAGLNPLPEEAPLLAGTPTSWVPQSIVTDKLQFPVVHPAFSLIALVERVVFLAIDRLIDLDQAQAILPQLSEDNLQQGVLLLRHLLAERMPLGIEGVKEELVRRLEAGEDPPAIMASLRALPGLRPYLWGNEPRYQSVVLPSQLEQRLADTNTATGWMDDLQSLLPNKAAAVLVVSSRERRKLVRDTIAPSFPELPVLAACEREPLP